MVYIRGHRSDYDNWAALGNPGWSYEEVLPYFRRAEDNNRFAAPYHGVGGPLGVSESQSDDPLRQIWLQAAREADGNTNAPTIMIAEKAADMIREPTGRAEDAPIVAPY
jgi:choline dehydrogenase-like flavoprotein